MQKLKTHVLRINPPYAILKDDVKDVCEKTEEYSC